MRIVFMGTASAAVPSLQKIIADGHEVVAVWTQPDRPAGRGNRLTASPVKEFALQCNLPVFQPLKIKTPAALELFRASRADLAVVVAYGRILPAGFLNSFPMGCINLHFSLLPQYRGAAPVNWAIVEGEVRTGVTTIQMDLGLDTGDILLQQETEIPRQENSLELMQRLSVIGAELLSETLFNLERLQPYRQTDKLATFAPMMKKEDGLIDWNLPANAIVNRVRGFQPFPTSYTYWNGKKITLWKCQSETGTNSGQNPVGSIMSAQGETFFVSCGNKSILRIDELQLEGKKRLRTKDFLNGVKVQIGERLG